MQAGIEEQRSVTFESLKMQRGLRKNTNEQRSTLVNIAWLAFHYLDAMIQKSIYNPTRLEHSSHSTLRRWSLNTLINFLLQIFYFSRGNFVSGYTASDYQCTQYRVLKGPT